MNNKKLICIKSSFDTTFIKSKVEKGDIIKIGYFAYKYSIDRDIIPIRDLNNIFLGWFCKRNFITLEEYREQQLNRILNEND